MAKRSGLGQVMCWRFSQSSLSGDSHGQSQCRPPIVRRPKVPPQRDELQQQINSEYTDNSHGTHIIMRRCFSFSCECPRSNVSWPGVPGPFKAKSFLKHPCGIRGLGGKDRHNQTDKYQLIGDHEKKRKKIGVYKLLNTSNKRHLGFTIWNLQACKSLL